MDRAWRWKFTGLVALVVLTVAYLMPTVVASEKLPDWFRGVFTKKITLGLDLQGGFQVLYSVDYDVAIDEKASGLRSDIEGKLKDELKLASTKVRSQAGGRLLVTMSADDLKKLPKDWMKGFSGLSKRTCVEGTAADTICLRVSGSFEESIRKSALKQAVRVIRERADEFGVAEPTIVERGDQIAVELPGAKLSDIERIKAIIDRTARLEFKIVEDTEEVEKYMTELAAKAESDPALKIDDKTRRINTSTYSFQRENRTITDISLTAIDEPTSMSAKEAYDRRCQLSKKVTAWDPGKEGDDKRKVDCTLSGQRILEEWLAARTAETPPPDGTELKLEHVRRRQEELEEDEESDVPKSATYWRTWVVRRSADLTGDAVSSAEVVWDQVSGIPEVSVNFTRSGGNRFEDLTGKNVGHRMAIILDEKVNSAPNIETKIGGGRARITMGGSNPTDIQTEAEDLVNVLRTGALPAPLQEEYVSQLGPSLGRDAIEKAQLAILIGTLMVILFMLFHYKVAGLIANIAMVLNILFMLGILVALNATLTLPGIAGLALTIGMAVDANIIIYERIRDELRAGKSPRGAVDAGFSRAFWTVFDAHITNAIAGFVLMSYGTGPIRGFAVTLLAGIACNLFTSVWVSRVMFDFMVTRKKQVAELSI